ncbi:TonB-dependent receptor domain-containing protein [Flavobacterium sp. NPDC079362]|uniref:TonB-dependent receptor domain-containing protein n=1 Tax=Flavobacterium sp. NPDC079362 TaxID=3390566 RepID=UPI003CFE9430
MHKSKINRLLFIVFILSNTVAAQIKFSGKVTTSEKSPLEYAEVILFSENSIALINRLTNEKGEFVIEYQKGKYKLEIRQFKEILYTKEIELTSDFDVGAIIVNVANVLETVVISKKKEVVERKVDRLVFNLENTISAAGGDALDALKVTPGLQVRNESITMIGKSSIRILIDGKMLEAGEEELANLLRSISADNIKSIEVITTPPAKYEASGSSGLININLKKAKKDSWSLSLGSGYLHRSEDGEGAMTSNFVYNKNKLALSSSLNYREGGEFFDYQDNIYFPDQLWRTGQEFKRNYKRINTILGLQYLATSKWAFGFQYMGNFNKTSGDRETKSTVYENNASTSFNDIIAFTNSSQKPEFNSMNFFNEIKLDSVGKKIVLNLDYFKYSNTDTRPYEGTSEIIRPYDFKYFKGINNNNQKTNNFSGKIDVDLPAKFINWSVGGKISVSKTNNDISSFNSGLVDNPVTDLLLTTNKFDYYEYIQAVYFSGNKKFENNIEVQFGTRLEATQTKSYDGSLKQTVSNNYTKFFPSINISYSPQQNSTFRFGYSKRIGRPNFMELNPNVTYVNPFLTVEGNPFLKPYFIDNFELIYSYKKLESKLYYSIENNMYNQIGLPDSTTYLVRLTNRNMFNVKRYGISELYIFDKFDWWTSNNVFVLNYLTSETINIPAKGVDGFYSTFSTNNDFVLNKTKTLLFNFNFVVMPVGTYGVNRLESSSSTALSVQYLVLNKDLRITLKANDIFKTDKMKFNSTVNGVYRDSNYYFDSRYIQLSLNYRFGNKNVNVGKREAGNVDERTRTGN